MKLQKNHTYWIGMASFGKGKRGKRVPLKIGPVDAPSVAMLVEVSLEVATRHYALESQRAMKSGDGDKVVEWHEMQPWPVMVWLSVPRKADDGGLPRPFIMIDFPKQEVFKHLLPVAGPKDIQA